MFPMMPGLMKRGGPNPILDGMSVSDGGLMGLSTIFGIAINTFPTFLPRLIAGDFSTDFTIAVYGNDSNIGFWDDTIPSPEYTFYFFDQNPAGDENVDATSPFGSLYYYAIDPIVGDLFFFTTTGIARKNLAPITVTGTLPSYPARTYNLSQGSASLILAWDRILSTSDMDAIKNSFVP